MTPPNSFSSSTFASAMPSSFHPSIPSTLPSYPRPQHQPKRLASQSFSHSQHQSSAAAGQILFRQAPQNPIAEPGRKRLQREFGESRNGFYAHSPPPLEPQDSDDEMRGSFYSDSAYRSALVPSNSRKRGLADDDVDDYGYSTGGKRTDANDGNPRGGKRRIIDVVGSVASRVWEFCKSKTPLFYASPPRAKKSEPAFQSPLASPTQPRNSAPRYPDSRFESPMPGQFFTELEGEGDGTTKMDYTTSLQSFTPDTAIKPTDVGLSTRWVMVSPNTHTSQPNGASTATTVGSRGATAPNANRKSNTRRPLLQRPVSSVARKRVRPPIIPRPAASATQTQNFSVGSTSPQSMFTFGGTRNSPPRTGNGNGSRPTSPRSRPGSSTASMANTRAGAWRKGHRREKSIEFDEEDESMKRFNDQLKAMIREGKEALGSKVEVVYDDEEEMGY